MIASLSLFSIFILFTHTYTCTHVHFLAAARLSSSLKISPSLSSAHFSKVLKRLTL